MKPVLIVQNDEYEGAGQLASLLSNRDFETRYVHGYATNYAELTPDRFSGLVVLGGAQGAYETDTYPYLLEEMNTCRAFIEADKPIVGLCLGAQLLACAVGGKVLPNDRKEIDWHDIVLTDAAADNQLMHDHPQSLL
jgi:GMP synthase (glutamine-hydrolysing)